MADENTETDPIAYQPPPTVVTLYDRNGRAHHTSPTSKFAVDGLADGSLTEQAPSEGEPGQEVPGGQSDENSSGDDPKPGDSDGGEGSGDGSAESGGSRRRGRVGQA